MLIDESWNHINNGMFALQSSGIDPVIPGDTTFFNVPASYHHRAGALNFADGHSEIKVWKDPRTWKGSTHVVNGVPSPNNKDLVWLLAWIFHSFWGAHASGVRNPASRRVLVT